MTNRAISRPLSEPAVTFLPEGRPYLLESSRTKDLVYLSWGRRRYSETPIPVTPHEGWVCSLILSGSPVLLQSGKSPRPIPRHTMVIAGPDTSTGWTDEKGRSCEQLTWIWRQSVLANRHADARHGLLTVPVAPSSLDRLKHLHQLCREEIAASDALTSRALKVHHEALQIELERNLAGSTKLPTAHRFAFALSWLVRHGSEPHPVGRLAEYLQISPSSLDRLFQKNTGGPVAEWLHHRKMDRAAALLGEGRLSKKQIAYELGYRHPCDFSRAWSRWQKRAPSAQVRPSAPLRAKRGLREQGPA